MGLREPSAYESRQQMSQAGSAYESYESYDIIGRACSFGTVGSTGWSDVLLGFREPPQPGRGVPRGLSMPGVPLQHPNNG